MLRLRKGSIRIEYDRTSQNDEITAYWSDLEKRPYYELEKNYTDGLGMSFLCLQSDSGHHPPVEDYFS